MTVVTDMSSDICESLLKVMDGYMLLVAKHVREKTYVP